MNKESSGFLANSYTHCLIEEEFKKEKGKAGITTEEYMRVLFGDQSKPVKKDRYEYMCNKIIKFSNDLVKPTRRLSVSIKRNNDKTANDDKPADKNIKNDVKKNKTDKEEKPDSKSKEEEVNNDEKKN